MAGTMFVYVSGLIVCVGTKWLHFLSLCYSTSTCPHTLTDYTPSLPIAEGRDLPVESLGDTLAPPALLDFSAPSGDPLQPPSWRTHVNSDRDILEDVSGGVRYSSMV